MLFDAQGSAEDVTAPDRDVPATDASKDAATSDATAHLQGRCGAGQVELGEYATWGGKVNVHRTLGEQWFVDDDCSSGDENNTVAYCQKFWPRAGSQVKLASVSKELKPFASAGNVAPECGGIAPFPGLDQYVCCQ